MCIFYDDNRKTTAFIRVIIFQIYTCPAQEKSARQSKTKTHGRQLCNYEFTRVDKIFDFNSIVLFFLPKFVLIVRVDLSLRAGTD